MATTNNMDLIQNGIINNVQIPSSPSRFVITNEFIYANQQSVRELINLRDSYAIWARKLSIVPATSDEYAAISEELGKIHTTLLAAKERMNLPLFRLPTSIEALDALIKKVEEQRAHLTPVDSTPKETVPSDTTLNSPSKRTLKNLRLKSDRKRLIDDDGFQIPDKRHTAKKIGKKNPSLPPTTFQTSNPTQSPPPPAESSDSEIEDEDADSSTSSAVAAGRLADYRGDCSSSAAATSSCSPSALASVSPNLSPSTPDGDNTSTASRGSRSNSTCSSLINKSSMSHDSNESLLCNQLEQSTISSTKDASKEKKLSSGSLGSADAARPKQVTVTHPGTNKAKRTSKKKGSIQADLVSTFSI
ncbi:leucine-rich repeat protein soc-2 [Trichonephila inaurata madagascariensis]|uniref:Leucine-rich repeat protein soc-2 n=1 Tax=Trichonephila inaurata madagascariensis TaxID=2747483 RepID=A0A8X6M9E1_9ARAC|nr:leucine-rich repeat protein soc-2 [Trichonephila inaurata madagascariensis]